jgi:hypothetical protein
MRAVSTMKHLVYLDFVLLCSRTILLWAEKERAIDAATDAY